MNKWVSKLTENGWLVHLLLMFIIIIYVSVMLTTYILEESQDNDKIDAITGADPHPNKIEVKP